MKKWKLHWNLPFIYRDIYACTHTHYRWDGQKRQMYTSILTYILAHIHTYIHTVLPDNTYLKIRLWDGLPWSGEKVPAPGVRSALRITVHFVGSPVPVRFGLRIVIPVAGPETRSLQMTLPGCRHVPRFTGHGVSGLRRSASVKAQAAVGAPLKLCFDCTIPSNITKWQPN